MSAHLGPAECIDALDGALAADRRAHLDACEQCRVDVALLAGASREVREVGVPEPSPLFWDHQAARIAEAIAAEPPPRSRGLPRLAWGGVVTAAVVAGLLVFVSRRVPPGTVAEGPVAAVARPAPAPVEAESDHAWTLLTTVGSDLDEDSAVDTLHPAPDAVDQAVGELDPDERVALAALLRDGLKPGNVSVAAGL